MNILKYAVKLNKMSSEEIYTRAQQQGRQQLEVVRWKLNLQHPDNNLFVPSQIAQWNLQKYPFPAPETRFFGLIDAAPALRELYAQHFPEQLSGIRAAADRLLKHQFHFLGLDVQLPDPIPWNQNPQTGRAYPMHHHALIETFNTEKYGDVKYVWELNRHQFFIEMGRAYQLTGEEKYAFKIWHWMASWIRDTPYKIGINHTSALEHAMRIFSWAWAYFLTRESPVWTPERMRLLVQQLLLQGKMIEENLSFYYSPYNHLIGELAALSFLGTLYHNCPEMAAWRDRYWQELETQLEKQFHPDGFTVEQASYYHHFTLGFYLMMVLLRQQNHLSISEKVWKHLQRALEFSMYLTRPDGLLPMLGDVDNARSIYFSPPEEQWNLRLFQAIGAVLFRRSDMKYIARETPEELLWLMGAQGISTFTQMLSSPPVYSSYAFFQSGYFVMRDGWHTKSHYCVFDCGDIAHGTFKDETPSAAHGHGDILSFEICINGKPLIIDPGFYTYFGDISWHRHFRATRGHNLIEVNNAGQAAHEGRITWSHTASPKAQYWLSKPELDFVSGRIDRFAKLPEDTFHQRCIVFRKGHYFLIIDEVSGKDTRQPFQIESSFHFVPGQLSYQDEQLYFNGERIALLSLPPETEIDIQNGGASADQGWIASGYGYKTPAPVLRFRVRKCLPARFALLFPLNMAIPPRFQVETLEPDILRYRIQFLHGNDILYLNPQQKRYHLPVQLPEEISYRDLSRGQQNMTIETDALGVLEQHSGNGLPQIHFIKALHLKADTSVMELFDSQKEADRQYYSLKYKHQ